MALLAIIRKVFNVVVIAHIEIGFGHSPPRSVAAVDFKFLRNSQLWFTVMVTEQPYRKSVLKPLEADTLSYITAKVTCRITLISWSGVSDLLNHRLMKARR